MKRIIKEFEKLKDKKVLFFCLGNKLKGDDGVGEYIFERIKETKNVFKINASISPLNYLDKIKKIKPDCTVIIDCVDMNKRPGSITLKNLKDLYSLPIDTHSNFLKEYIEAVEIETEWYILGIQPEQINMPFKLSDIVKERAEELLKIINKIFS